jgi:hypothetical protein
VTRSPAMPNVTIVIEFEMTRSRAFGINLVRQVAAN